MKQEAKGPLADSLRSWVSVAITIHFFAIIISLAANISPSQLEQRLLKVLAPYTGSLHQNYAGVPLEMTRGTEIDYPCEFEIHRAGAASDQWQTVRPPKHFGSALDHRWRTFQRMANIVAIERNEDLIQLLFEQCVRQEAGSGAASGETASDNAASTAAIDAAPIDAVRLVRRATLSYDSDQTFAAGELPPNESQDRTLSECRVVRLEGDRIKLVPVLEALRTSKSLSKQEATAEASPARSAPTSSKESAADEAAPRDNAAEPEKNSPEDEPSSEVQP
ncbi:MAG: hypothetical protein ACTHK7_19635 [Aureliella sp.]